MHRSPLVLLIIGAAIIRCQLPFLRRTHAKEDGDYPQGCLHCFLWILAKSRWNRHFGTNDLCETGIFQVIKVYFWGGMAERRCIKNILQVHEEIITCAENFYLMYALDGLDSCNFYNEGMWFFSRTAPIILPNSFDVKKRRFDRKKRPLCFLKI